MGNQAWVDQETRLVLAGPRQAHRADPHHHQPADPRPTIEDHSVADRHDLDRHRPGGGAPGGGSRLCRWGLGPGGAGGPRYRRVELERYEPPQPVDCVVASTVAASCGRPGGGRGPGARLLAPGGVLVVVEWAWERFDEATARWCFSRLTPPAPGLSRAGCTSTRSGGRPPGQPWDDYCRAWAEQEGLHPGEAMIRGLDARFNRQFYAEGPYFFPDLTDTGEAQEQAAIDAG